MFNFSIEKVVGILLIGWGIFSLFNKSYFSVKYGSYINLGENHMLIGIIEIIIGVFLLYKSTKRNGKTHNKSFERD